MLNIPALLSALSPDLIRQYLPSLLSAPFAPAMGTTAKLLEASVTAFEKCAAMLTGSQMNTWLSGDASFVRRCFIMRIN